MYRKPLPDQSYLHECLFYCGITGKLFWRERPLEHFPSAHRQKVWNTRYAGKECFNRLNCSGYLHGTLDNTGYVTHRIIYKMLHNVEPAEVDHDNRDRTDNRPQNLNASTHVANNQNKKRNSNNSSGVMGVCFQQHAKKWRAKIRNTHIGYFDSFDEAVAAREQALTVEGYHPSHGK